MSKLVTKEMFNELGTLVLSGRIKTMHMETRTTGKNKGKVYVDYTLHAESNVSDENRGVRLKISNYLGDLAENPLQYGYILFKKPFEDADTWQFVVETKE